MVAWPATLPQSPYLKVTETRQSATLRSAMDAGPPKVRRRFTAAVRHIDVVMFLTGPQKTTFDTFFNTTISEGAVSFDWTDPISGGTVSMRFREPPAWTQVRAGTVANKLWQAVFALEILP
ncbi:hypothetical protein LCGC14_1601510 [marine sediment metagenome]|uniref:Uncharacterized protein n=1 Tax=marine sediment metagenome TaxID=412755 RepID=A0A0F9LB35_9ZZZZ